MHPLLLDGLSELKGVFVKSPTFHPQLLPKQPQRWSPFAMLLAAFLLLSLGAWAALGALDAQPTLAAPRQPQAITLQLTPFATGLTDPVKITHADDDRLFVVQQTGEIMIVQPDGSVLETPFLDINDRVLSGGERGLLGLAFEPGNAAVFYVNYTIQSTNNQLNGDTIIARYRVTGNDPNVADPASEEIILTVNQPEPNHNGGDLAFGGDGFLYIPLGDGGGTGDPESRAQDLSELLGKVLRIEVTGAPTYTIPTDNPYANDNNPDTRAEIWASGLRNPWRFSFDRQTQDIYLGDVGQSAWEEIDFQPATSTGGENYGWDCREGAHPYTGQQSPECTQNGGYVDPIFEYSRTENQSNPSAPCSSITGGYVYRGTAYPSLVGHYLLADYCSGKFWSLIRDDQSQWMATAHGKLMNSPSGFGENQNGELYVASLGDGIIYRVAPDPTTVTPTATPMPTVTATVTIVPTIPPDQDKRLYLPYIEKDGTN